MVEIKAKHIETIDLKELLKEYQISDLHFLENYFTEIWSDLSQRTEDLSRGVEKLTFGTYYKLPGIIIDRLFSVFDKNQNGILDCEEFINGMKTLFFQGESFDSLVKFIFKFYDFDQDEIISREDVRVVLSYVPLQQKKTNNLEEINNNFEDRAESQEQLFWIINNAFGISNKMDLKKYVDVIENINSDIFILLLMLLLENKPFTDESVIIYNANKKYKKIQNNSLVKPQKIAFPSLNSRFIFPCLLKLIILALRKKNVNILEIYEGNSKQIPQTLNKKIQESYQEYEKEEKIKGTEKNDETRKIIKNLDNLKENMPFPSSFTFDKQDTQEKEQRNISRLKTNENTEIPYQLIKNEGYVYNITPSKKIKQLYFKLVGKDFFCYEKKGDRIPKGMHNLSGVYFKKGEKVLIGEKNYYSFEILYSRKTRIYYFETEKEQKDWYEKLQSVIEYKNLLEKYEVKRKLGKGKFSLVKYGIQKETNKPVAIKILCKREMDSSDLELAKTEVDILRISQHPNIIRLYDVFNNIDYIYIVMEYCGGGDLFSYIKKRDFKISEARACEIIHKLVTAIYYLHSYGIVHRDIKPENILMTDKSDSADIKLLDFGLSKIVGPSQKCSEPYGSLSFVAPEVLKGKLYDKSVDIWSIGIITYFLLCGCLPFDNKVSEKEIARQAIEDNVPFPSEIWKNISDEAKHLVEGLLKKEPQERFTIEQILQHPWLKKFSKVSQKRLSTQEEHINKFKAYTSI